MNKGADKKKYKGETARKWRQRVGCGGGGDDTTFTIKYLLETPKELDFDAANRLYNIVNKHVDENCGLGSLNGLLCAMHLSGFHLYPTVTKRKSATQFDPKKEKIFMDSVRRKWPDFEPPQKFNHKEIKNSLSTAKRRIDFTPEAVADKFMSAWSTRKNRPEELRQFAQTAAKAVCGEFQGNEKPFQEWKNNPIRAQRAASQQLAKELNINFPTDKGETIDAPNEFDGATILSDNNRATSACIDESAPHQIVALMARDCRRKKIDNKKEIIKQIQEKITGGNNSEGLSWLFGVGWEAFCRHEESDLAKYLNADAENIARIKEYAAAISPEVPFFNLGNYSAFRQRIGGLWRSWIANYWNRLDELRESFDNLPDMSKADEFLPPEFDDPCVQKDILKGLNLTAAVVREQVRKAAQKFAEGRELIDQFMGLNDASLPNKNSIGRMDSIAGYMESTGGIIFQIQNQAEQRRENGERFYEHLEIKIPDWLKKPRKLNRFSGGNSDPHETMRDKAEEFNRTLKEWLEHGERLVNAAKKRDASEDVTKRLLHRVGRLAQRLEDTDKKELSDIMSPHFHEPKECNRFLFNRQGALWKSPHSTSRHQPYLLRDSAYRRDWHALLDELAERWRQKSERDDVSMLRNWLELQNLLFAERLRNALPDLVSADLTRPGESVNDNIPASWALQLESDKVPRDLCLRIFNLYHSKLRGLLFGLLRGSFILRASLQMVMGDMFAIQTPKTEREQWKIPDRFRHKNGRRASMLAVALGQISPNGDITDIEKSHERMIRLLFKEKQISPEAAAAYFAQVPHEWYLIFRELRDGGTPKASGVALTKNGELRKSVRNGHPALRVRGPSAHKNRILQVLLRKWKASENSLIVEQSCRQKTAMQNGKLSVEAFPDKVNAFGAVPFKPSAEVPKLNIFDKLVAIDLGERGIGFAVFDVKDFLEKNGDKDRAKEKDIPPHARGNIPIPAIRALINAGKRHRSVSQPRQQIQQNFSNALAKRRAAVIGKVCNEIENLCREYAAFPVLESQVRGLESGGKQLLLIYKSVVNRYVWSDVKAHGDTRQHHWFGGRQWKHPYLRQRERDQNGDWSGDSCKEFRLYPGDSVNAAGTSQKCSRCGRNPMSKENTTNGCEVRNGGLAKLPGGEIRLFGFSQRDDNTARRAREYVLRKLRSPWWEVPLKPDRYDEKKLRGHLKFNMRRQPRSSRSKDTSQSRYFCPYTDCTAHWSEEKLRNLNIVGENRIRTHGDEWGMHADENAAVNIGRRFLLSDKLHRKKSAEELRKISE